MRRTARHRVETSRSSPLVVGGCALAGAARSVVVVARAPEGRAWPRRTLILAGAASLALTIVGLHDPSALTARAAVRPAPAAVASAPAPKPAPVRYTVPAATVTPAAVRDGYGITLLPPPEPPKTVTWPVPSTTPVSSPFGPRVAPCPSCSADHHGIDLIPGEGTPVASIAAGTVVSVGTDPAAELGVFVVIRHAIDGETVESVYGHLMVDSVPVAVGDRIDRGTVIGRVGNTGESTGPHLHFGISTGGRFVDPQAWMAAHAEG